MKALQYQGPGTLAWVDTPTPTLTEAEDVLVKPLAIATCDLDWEIIAGRTPFPAPFLLGHEFVGEIVAVGSNVNDFEAGQIVSGEGHVVCGRCRNCMAGRRHLCAKTSGVGVNRPGAFAEYLKLPAFNVVPLPDDIPDEIGAILDPLGNAVHTALSFDLLGEDVLITGAGPIGIMAAAVTSQPTGRITLTTVSLYLPPQTGLKLTQTAPR